MTARRASLLSGLVAWLVVGGAAPSETLQEGDLSDRLVTANRILAMEGLVGPYGHISARADGESFWVADHRSPDSVERRHMKKVQVGLSEEAARGQHLYREIFIHSEIYRMLPAVGAVVHIHAPHSVALGTLSLPERLRPTTNPGANLGEFIPIYGAVGLIENIKSAEQVARALQGQNGVLLRGHGAVVVGESVEQAVLRAIYLELEARYQLMSRAAGSPTFFSAQESARFSGTTAVEHAWQYYVDKLSRQKRN